MKALLLLPFALHFSLISLSQNVGINVINPAFPLSFPETLGDKISLWGNSGNHYGFGIQGYLLQIHGNEAAADIAFGYGRSSSFNEVMRVKGNGRVGIGINSPTASLHLKSTSGGSFPQLRLDENSDGYARLNFNNTTTPFAWTLGGTTNAANSNSRFVLYYEGLGSNVLNCQGDGNVGIGVDDPSLKLEVGGRMRVRSGGGSAGIFFNKNDNSAKSSFIGTYDGDDSYLGFFGENGAGWNFFMNTGSGNTGIGTVPNPGAKLHVNTGNNFASGFLVTGNVNNIYGAVPDFGAGSRMMFYPPKAAFRAGFVNGSQWDNSYTGFYSTAFGYNTTASGAYATALGNSTVASGRHSAAMGIGTYADAFGAVAIGHYNDNSGGGDPVNIVASNRIFQVGNGSSGNARANAMTILQNGYTGIGVIFPEQILDVADRIRLRSGPQGTAGIWFNRSDNADATGFMGTYLNDFIGMYGHQGAGWGLVMNTTNGNVGIGTDNPTYKLAVNGSIRSKEIRVESGWADFVFEKNYKLIPLNEVENYISKNKRLPGFPDAKEISENGLPVGEMQTKMMQKIEELTLYLIEANNRIAALEKIVFPLRLAV